jgi:hypothetical protein
MTDDKTTTPTLEVKVHTEVDLKAKSKELQDYSKQANADWKVIAKMAAELAKMGEVVEKSKRDAALKILETTGEAVKTAIQKAIQPFIDNKSLDVADGIWFSQDFGEKLISIRLSKSAVRKTSSGTSTSGGTGKKYDVSTNDLLTKYGETEYKDKVTFKVAWDADPDKNKRYAIREALIKKAKSDGTIK